jgi:dienelactone hydrolase
MCSELTTHDALEKTELPGPRPTYKVRGSSGPAVVVLHELTGLSDHDIALGRRLAGNGFTVYLPLLFGEPGQDRFLKGYFESCVNGPFICSTPSMTSPIVDDVREVCEAVARRSGPLGVVGMCLTGAFPLALLSRDVRAAVLCQPTLPFGLFAAIVGLTERERNDLGLSHPDIERARASDVPLLALRYVDDWRCPRERLDSLERTFPGRVARIELTREHHPGGGHHSTLAADCDRTAFADTVAYLRARLGLAREPSAMRLATFERRACRITADGQWEAR